MLKATIDKNEPFSSVELKGSSLELANDLALLIASFTKSLMEEHSIDDATTIVIEACTSGIADALEGSEQDEAAERISLQ